MKKETDDLGVTRVYPFGERSYACIMNHKKKYKINLSLNDWYTEEQIKELVEQIKTGLEEFKKETI